MDASNADGSTVEVRDSAERSRWEVVVDGEVAGFADYSREGDVVTVPHTEVSEEYAGRGLAKRLVAEMLDGLAAQGLRLVPECPLVRKQLAGDQAGHLGLVTPEARERFAL